MGVPSDGRALRQTRGNRPGSRFPIDTGRCRPIGRSGVRAASPLLGRGSGGSVTVDRHTGLGGGNGSSWPPRSAILAELYKISAMPDSREGSSFRVFRRCRFGRFRPPVRLDPSRPPVRPDPSRPPLRLDPSRPPVRPDSSRPDPTPRLTRPRRSVGRLARGPSGSVRRARRSTPTPGSGGRRSTRRGTR